jgi:HAUS augmin-like complex subunit 6 N-terminus
MDHGVRHAAGAAPPSANISLLVRNLRLLDLDLRSNWPGITVQTFSTKDANQNLRQRVKCVEWALYQLFALWDLEETNNVCTECMIPDFDLRS